MSDDFVLWYGSSCAEQYMNMVGHTTYFDGFYAFYV